MMYKGLGIFLPMLYADNEVLPLTSTSSSSSEDDPWRNLAPPMNWQANVGSEDPGDFDAQYLTDHSDKLDNARFARVDNFDDGNEFARQPSFDDRYYGPSHCIDGVIDHLTQRGVQCVAKDRSLDNFFADITGAPNINVVKIHLNYHNSQNQYANWGRHFMYRVFVDQTECKPIEYYDNAKIATLFDTRQPMIFYCDPNMVMGATQVRVSCGTQGVVNEPVYLFFSEISIWSTEQPCDADPCQNGATCINNNQDYTCDCAAGWVGEHCDLETACTASPCLIPGTCHPCQNGGTCEDVIDTTGLAPSVSYTCTCADGFFGDNCEIASVCTATTCQNGGTCVDTMDTTGLAPVPDYTCDCLPDHLGEHCEHPPVCQADDTPCQNGGTCTNTVDNSALVPMPAHTCTCPADHLGDNCEHPPVCQADGHPCQNGGTCTNTVDNSNLTPMPAHTCSCPTGFLGDNCELAPVCLTSPCQNGGTCTDTVVNNVPAHTCACPAGFGGTNCDLAPVCQTSPCANFGVCTDTMENGVPAFTCACQMGWTGDTCAIPSPCNNRPCLNGGTCRDRMSNGIAGFRCTCVNGFTGNTCATPPRQPCDDAPCLNGGVCTNQVTNAQFPNGYSCLCSNGRWGSRCEQPNPCWNNPCRNGGRCIVRSRNPWWDRNRFPQNNFAQCQCNRGWRGSWCGIRIWIRFFFFFWGDVHYTTIDGQSYANQGWCNYILTTNGLVCNEATPSAMAKTDPNFYKTGDSEKDFFSVIVDHEPLDSDPNYETPVSVLNGVDVIVRPRLAPDSIFKFSASKAFGSGYGVKLFKSEFDTDADDNLIWTDENANARFTGNYNAHAQNVGIRISGVGDSQIINFFIGCGQSGEEGAEFWHLNSAIDVNHCLMKIVYNPAAGSIGIETTEVMKNTGGDTKLCGIAGNFDGQPDFDENMSDSDKLDYETDQEIANYYRADTKCPYVSDSTVKAGIPIPMDSGTYYHTASSRKKRATTGSCAGDIATITAACEVLNGPKFSACGLDRTRLIEGCIFDACSAPNQVDTFVCQMATSFVASCNSDFDTSYEITNWREANFCPLPCGDNQEFKACGKPACHPTVHNCQVDTGADSECAGSDECIEGCYCQEGYLQDGNTCSTTCRESEITEMEKNIAASSPCAGNPCRNGAVCTKNPNDSTDYNCACTDGFTGKDCDHSEADEFNSPYELLEYLINGGPTSRRKRSLVASEVGDHGCYCTRLLTGKGVSGKATSDYDQMCKDMFVCHQCGAGSACSWSEMYPYKVKIANGDYVCDNTADSCQQSACECDLHHLQKLIQYERDTGDSVDAGGCVEVPAAGETFECCGSGLTYQMYNTRNKECQTIDGEEIVV